MYSMWLQVESFEAELAGMRDMRRPSGDHDHGAGGQRKVSLRMLP